MSTTYTGTGVVASTDYHKIEWKGVTKDGSAVTITLDKAINMGNIDLAFAEKGETVAQVVYTAVYSNTNAASSSDAEPWKVTFAGSSTNASDNIICGSGIFYIDQVAVALTRGGGSFSVARTFRNINADGDRGPVEGRIAMDDSVATLTMNTLEIITAFDDIYAGVNKTTA